MSKELNIKICSHCLLNSSLPGVYINSNGMCNYCRMDRGKASLTEKERLKKIWHQSTYMKRPVIVAFSGGNDSAACLIYLVKSIGVECIAVMMDNGFIPDAVRQRAIDLCRQLGVKLSIESFALVDMLPNGFCDPCSYCIPVILESLALKARNCRSIAIATGHLYPPSFEILRAGTTRIIKTAPLYIDDIHEKKRGGLLKNTAWDEEIFFGPSSNCTLMGYLESIYRDKWGYSPMIAELSHEVRAGMISRETGIKKLAREKVFPLDQYRTEQYKLVEALLKKKGKLTA